MRGGERKDPFIIADKMAKALHEQNKCGTEVVGALYCGCATVGLTNRCGQISVLNAIITKPRVTERNGESD